MNPTRAHLFADLEQFVQTLRPCGELAYDAGELTPQGYRLWVWCSRSAVFDPWVTPEAADEDLLRSGLLALPN